MALRSDQTLEVLNARSKGRLPELVGYRVTALEEGKVTAELDIRPDLVAPNGYLHAATDCACGHGVRLRLPRAPPAGAELFTTIEFKANFLGTATEGTIACVATPAHLGNTTQVWDAVVTRKADGRKLALFRCTQLVIWPKKA
jgi:uncharacterized protein (TIGR00369 family)